MTIQIDTREKPKAIKKILAEFDKQGVKTISSKLFVGDYMNLDNARLVIDRKQNLLEVASNCVQDYNRFTAELLMAQQAGIKLIVLVEHGYNIEKLEDVIDWVNPRLKESPMAVSGERLYRIMAALAKKFDFTWAFCNKEETGAKIIELLGGKDG